MTLVARFMECTGMQGDQHPEGPRLCNGFVGRPLSECGVRTMGFVQPSSVPSLDGEVTLQVPSLSQCSSYNREHPLSLPSLLAGLTVAGWGQGGMSRFPLLPFTVLVKH